MLGSWLSTHLLPSDLHVQYVLLVDNSAQKNIFLSPFNVATAGASLTTAER